MIPLLLALFATPAYATSEIKPNITQWESICERHLIGLDYSEEIDVFQSEGGARAIEREYVFESSRVIWQKTFNLHQIRRIQAYGSRLRLLDPTNEKLEVYGFLEELWPKPHGVKK